MSTSALSLAHHNLRRLFRVASSAVLEVRVTYPVLSVEGEENTISQKGLFRFNDAYRTMAEKFLEWCEGVPAETARADFAAAGSRAVYTFDRHIITCRMSAELDEQNGMLCVMRTVLSGSRRGGERTVRETVDRWRAADLSLTSNSARG